jgi:hypothetical protein
MNDVPLVRLIVMRSVCVVTHGPIDRETSAARYVVQIDQCICASGERADGRSLAAILASGLGRSQAGESTLFRLRGYCR